MIPHDFPFDPTYGYTLHSLLEVGSPDGPPDFADFWRSTYDEALTVAPNAARRRIASPDPALEIFEVEYDSFRGTRIGGWITIPADGHFECGTVLGHGYGGREAPDPALPGPPMVTIQPCIRWFHRSSQPDFPEDTASHVLHGIQSRETYSHRGSVADLWCAASALIELFPKLAEIDRLYYSGTSFGGGIGAMALPWDPRFKKGFLKVPSFGNHPLRVTLPCTGSGEAIRLHHEKRPEAMEVLQYFDSSTAARHIQIPVTVACALFDPSVPPPGQFAVYNAIPGEKQLIVLDAAHFTSPRDKEENDEISTALERWFS